jgi:hypothetical protein
MVLVLGAVLLAVGLVVAIVINGRRVEAESAREAAGKLPSGADAALWSIVEAVPDPRNHLALTRDLTGEVRIAGTLLDPDLRIDHDEIESVVVIDERLVGTVHDPEFRAATLLPPPAPKPAGGSSVRILTAAEIEAEDLREREAREQRRSQRRTERAS